MLEPDHLTVAPPFKAVVGQVLCVLMYEIYFADLWASEALDGATEPHPDTTDSECCTGKGEVAADDGVQGHAANASERAI